MHLSLLDNALWAAGFFSHVALIVILISRQRVRSFPLFTAFVADEILTTIALFATYRLAGAHAYARVYWSSAALEFLLIVALLAEIAYIVFRPASRWIAHSRARLICFGLAAILLASGLSLWVDPHQTTWLDLWRIRANLFTSILTCELFTVILLTSQRMGLHWRSHVMHLGYGLTTWALVSFLVDGLHAYWGRAHYFTALEHLRSLAYLGTLSFWIGAFWRDEPKSALATPAMQETVLHLSDRLGYDLAKALHPGPKESH